MWSQSCKWFKYFCARIPCDSPFSRVAWSYMGRAPKGWEGAGVWQPLGEAATAGESKGLVTIGNSVFCAGGRCFWASQHLVPQTLHIAHPQLAMQLCWLMVVVPTSLLSSISWDKCHSLIPVCLPGFGIGPCGMKYEPLLLSYSEHWAWLRRQKSTLEMLRGILESPKLLYISWAVLQNALGVFLHCSGLRSSHEALKKLWVWFAIILWY